MLRYNVGMARDKEVSDKGDRPLLEVPFTFCR
jgi:hypothetical protein